MVRRPTRLMQSPAMNQSPTPQAGILNIDPYVPGKSAAPHGVTPIKLSANESPLGASPAAIAAFRSVSEGLASYPDGSCRALRQAIGEVHGLDAERIVVGAGSDEILHLLAQSYLGEGDEAVISRYGFAVYPIVTLGAGATPVFAEARDYGVDVDAMLGAVTPRTRMVFLDNPNNPTGTCLSGAEVRRLHAGLPPEVLLVIDNAYAEYVTAGDFETGADLAVTSRNVVMVRTFSKMGLAALRVGWMFGPAPIVDVLNRLRGPFNVSVPGQAAAEAAVRDVGFTRALCDHNARWRDWLSAELGSNRLRVLPSQGNFILVLFPDEPGLTAADANAALLARGLIVREMTGYGLPQALRISIGTEAAMRAVAEVLKAFGGGK